MDAEVVAILAAAFETAWEMVQKSGSPLGAPEQALATRKMMAKRIIELGQLGERNPQRLLDEALLTLTQHK
jgi:hypothetical protein